MISLPRMVAVRQVFAPTPKVEIDSTVRSELAKLRPRLRKGMRIAVGVGSRGIAHFADITAAVVSELKVFGTEPFLIPAMGSHGGATPAGQLEVLASYGITPESMGVPILASLDVREVGRTADGVAAFCSTDALQADGIILINRVKPHTDFFGSIGSGLLKMCVIGLGKRKGAETMHLAATEFGYERAIRTMAQSIIDNTAMIGGIAVVENQFHETALVEAVDRDDMPAAEERLHAVAKSLMPLLPFDEIDLLIVDRMGKNISGTGMDPNVINRSIHGYDSLPVRGDRSTPFIKRIFVRGLTAETAGNAIGIGMADAVTTQCAQDVDHRKTSINALTALTPQSAKIPIVFDSDQEAIERMLVSLPLVDYRTATVVRIADTLSTAHMLVSEALLDRRPTTTQLERLSAAEELRFDALGNLIGETVGH
ncbi:MAG: hypothetical protein U0892_09870 [Pirellulales bacterium]